MAEPDPSQVLKEAEAATKAGRYEEALEKHVWYHENALRIQPSQFGVRLSFALISWGQLARCYPPALRKLRAIRDETVQRVYSDDAEPELFADIAALNDLLDHDEKTVELFRWFETNRPGEARFAYFFVHDVLIKRKEFGLCGKYITVPDDFETAVEAYQIHLQCMERIEDKEHPDRAKAEEGSAREHFSNSVCTMVALLVLNDRKPEAVEYAAKAKEFLDDTEFHANLDKALDGVVPERWPPSIGKALHEEGGDE